MVRGSSVSGLRLRRFVHEQSETTAIAGGFTAKPTQALTPDAVAVQIPQITIRLNPGIARSLQIAGFETGALNRSFSLAGRAPLGAQGVGAPPERRLPSGPEAERGAEGQTGPDQRGEKDAREIG